MVTSSQTSSSSEVELLKNRINDTEHEKRDLVGVVDRLKEDSAMRDGELFVSVLIPGAFSRIILNTLRSTPPPRSCFYMASIRGLMCSFMLQRKSRPFVQTSSKPAKSINLSNPKYVKPAPPKHLPGYFLLLFYILDALTNHNLQKTHSTNSTP